MRRFIALLTGIVTGGTVGLLAGYYFCWRNKDRQDNNNCTGWSKCECTDKNGAFHRCAEVGQCEKKYREDEWHSLFDPLDLTDPTFGDLINEEEEIDEEYFIIPNEIISEDDLEEDETDCIEFFA